MLSKNPNHGKRREILQMHKLVNSIDKQLQANQQELDDLIEPTYVIRRINAIKQHNQQLLAKKQMLLNQIEIASAKPAQSPLLNDIFELTEQPKNDL